MKKNIMTKKPTTFVVVFWTKKGEFIKEMAFPMHKFSFEDVCNYLKGKEEDADIFEGRFSPKRNKYLKVGNTYLWDEDKWVVQ